MDPNTLITVLVPTSPIPSNPDTFILEDTLKAIRYHLPTAKIIILMDGVRPACEPRTADYAEFKHRVRVRCEEGQYGNASFLEFGLWTMQADMVRHALQYIQTPLVLFNEHDATLVTTENPRDGRHDTLPQDLVIDWEAICQCILGGQANTVRLYYVGERTIPDHDHLMRDEFECAGVKFKRTVQFSGWPHVSSLEFYRRLFKMHFIPGKRDMLECPIYGIISDAPWEEYKTVIYYPDENARRFKHTNGRALPDGSQEKADW
jgi:hypothetical protein